MIYTRFKPVYFFSYRIRIQCRFRKKGHFWSRITSKSVQKWLYGEMTLKSESFIIIFLLHRIKLHLFDLIYYALGMYSILCIYLIESSPKQKFKRFIR